MLVQTLTDTELKTVSKAQLIALAQCFNVPSPTSVTKRRLLTLLESNTYFCERLLTLGQGTSYVRRPGN